MFIGTGSYERWGRVEGMGVGIGCEEDEEREKT
jgi:hypothetical protein